MMGSRFLAGAALALALGASAVQAQDGRITTPEGAVMDAADDVAYKPGELSLEQLEASNADILISNGMNVFRRFPSELTDDMVRFYTKALALDSLSPIQLTATQQMILTGVGSMQIKLSAGLPEGRRYDLDGGYRGGTGIRFFMLRYPDQEVLTRRFVENGFHAPEFTVREDGVPQAIVQDPGGFDIVLQIEPGAKDGADDGIGVGISVSNLEASRKFYREFVGLEERDPIAAPVLGAILYPYRHGETSIMLYHVAPGLPADDGSAGIQYIVNNAPLAAARGDFRDIPVQTPLNKMRGFDLVTVWLSDPDGVTNYFAQIQRAPN